MDSKVVQQLKEIAELSDSKVNFNVESDKSYIDCDIKAGNIELYLTLTRFDDYYAYDLASPGLPREIYSDSLENGFSTHQRSDEIVASLQALLDKTISFYPTPGLINKSKGHIFLSIDGKVTKHC